MENINILELTTHLTQRITDLIGSEEPIGKNDKLFSSGFNSARATVLAVELEELLQHKVSPTVFYAYPTIAELAEYFVGKNKKANKKASPFTQGKKQQPMAIVGFSCRFPQAQGIEAFWNLLVGEVDATSEIPKDRWKVDDYYDEDPMAEGKTNARHGAFIKNVDEFDPYFFDISPREAHEMSPDQKMCLELAWEAFAHAQIKAEELRGSKTGVFIGNVWNDFAHLRIKKHAPINQHSAIGQSGNIIANRISYIFGFQGPSLVIDTACSSSLYTIHLAGQALNDGDCEVALVGGVNVMLDPDSYVHLSKFGGLSPTGKCHTFSADADGYVRGEGAGMVVIKPLNKALQDGNRIYAVVRGSAVNNDGASNGLTAPNMAAQKDVLRMACHRAGFAPSEIHYIEAHGTGTKLGDPIEAEALAEVYGEGREDGNPLLLGSAKTNIGHLEGAAGIAGLIKVVLSMKKQVLPKSLNFDAPNPYIPFKEWKLKVNDQTQHWQAKSTETRKAGISSFGWGGTNAHVILEEYVNQKPEILIVAADTDKELLTVLRDIRKQIEANEQLSLKGICSQYANTDTHKSHRVALKAHTTPELLQRVKDVMAFDETSKYEVVQAHKKPKIVYTISPVGGQYLEMAINLLENDKFFREKMATCDHFFTKIASWSLREKLYSLDLSELDQLDKIIPLIFAIQVSLSDQLLKYGVKPSAVIGHSMGEISAAYIAGFLTLEDAIEITYHYSRLLQTTAGMFSMAVITTSQTLIAEELVSYDSIEIAGINSDSSCNVSGLTIEIDKVVKDLNNKGVRAAKINVAVPAHTSHVAGILEELERCVEHITTNEPKISMYSTSLGRYITDKSEINAQYWSRNLGEKVLFGKGIKQMLSDGYDTFIELSPHAVVKNYINQSVTRSDKHASVYYTLERDATDSYSIQNLLMLLYLKGLDIEWAKLYSKYLIPTHIEGVKPSTKYTNVLILPISAKTEEITREYAQDYLKYIQEKVGDAPQDIYDLCATAAHKQSTFDYRVAFTGKSKEEITEQIQDFLDNPNAVIHGNLMKNQKMAFVFSGQGGQWLGMGKELIDEYDIFRKIMEVCDKSFKKYNTGWSLIEQLKASKETSLLTSDISYIQPAIFAVQISLARLWMSWGVIPKAVIGHSMGEVAAAYIAGAIRLDDAAKIICTRSKLMSRLSGQGKMMVVEMSYEEATSLCKSSDGIEVAVNNSPKSCVIGGSIEAINQLEQSLLAQDIYYKPVQVDIASHTLQMDSILEALREEFQGIVGHPENIPIYSSVKASLISGEEMSGDYWVKNVRSQVKFAQTIKGMIGEEYGLFMEMSPHPILSYPVGECIKAAGKEGASMVIPSTRRNEDEERELLKNLGVLYSMGYNVPWRDVYRSAENFVTLPHYPWHREVYTIEDHSEEFNTHSLKRNDGSTGHPFLGQYIELANQEGIDVWETRINFESMPFLKAYKSGEHYMLPVSVYIEMLEAAIDELYHKADYAGHDLQIHQSLSIKEGYSPILQLKVQYHHEKLSKFEIFAANLKDHSHKKRHWKLMASGKITLAEEVVKFPSQPLHKLVHGIEPSLQKKDFYNFLKTFDFDYDHDYQCVTAVWSLKNRVIAKLEPTNKIKREQEKYKLHPILIGSCIRTLGSIMPIEMHKEVGQYKYYVDSIGSMHIINRNAYKVPLWAECEVYSYNKDTVDEEGALGNFTIYDRDGQAIARSERFHIKRRLRHAKEDHQYLHELIWRKAQQMPLPPSTFKGTYLLFAQNNKIGDALYLELLKQGVHVIVVYPHYAFKEWKNDGVTERISINPLTLAHYQELWQTVQDLSPEGIKVVYAWPARSTMEDPSYYTPEALIDDVYLYGSGLLSILQTHLQASLKHIDIITSNALEIIPKEAINLPASTVWALARTLRNEHLNISYRNFDIATDISNDEIARLVSQITSLEGETEQAFRGNAVYTPRLEAFSESYLQRVESSGHNLESSSTYLIVGSLGSYLGIGLIHWMIQREAKHIILIDSDAPTMTEEASLAQFKQSGIYIEVIKIVGTSHKLHLQEALGKIRQLGHPIKGIFYMTPNIPKATLHLLTNEQYIQSVEQSIKGAWNLHQLTLDDKIEHFTLFSNVASLGLIGKSADTSIGGFFDALVSHRKSLGLPALSVSWGATSSEKKQVFKQLDTAQYLHLFERIFASQVSHVGIWDFDFDQWKSSKATYAAEKLFEYFHHDAEENTSTQTEKSAWFSLDNPKQKIEWIENLLKQLVAQITKANPRRVNTTTPFKGLGIDSLMLVQLRNLLDEETSLNLSVSSFFSYPTIKEYAQFINEQLGEEVGSAIEDAEETLSISTKPVLASEELSSLSLEELSKALEDELNEDS